MYDILGYSIDVKTYIFSHFNDSEIKMHLPSMASYHYNRQQYFFLGGAQNNDFGDMSGGPPQVFSVCFQARGWALDNGGFQLGAFWIREIEL